MGISNTCNKYLLIIKANGNGVYGIKLNDSLYACEFFSLNEEASFIAFHASYGYDVKNNSCIFLAMTLFRGINKEKRKS